MKVLKSFVEIEIIALKFNQYYTVQNMNKKKRPVTVFVTAFL